MSDLRQPSRSANGTPTGQPNLAQPQPMPSNMMGTGSNPPPNNSRQSNVNQNENTPLPTTGAPQGTTVGGNKEAVTNDARQGNGQRRDEVADRPMRVLGKEGELVGKFTLVRQVQSFTEKRGV